MPNTKIWVKLNCIIQKIENYQKLCPKKRPHSEAIREENLLRAPDWRLPDL